ncbi:hypothetical protein ARSEF4850_002720 [Beauveria asiatica]
MAGLDNGRTLQPGVAFAERGPTTIARPNPRPNHAHDLQRKISIHDGKASRRPRRPQLENGLCQTGSAFGPAEAQPDTSYPERGRAATVVLLGSFCALAGGLGLMNSMGVYAGPHQLAATASPGRVAWIFGRSPSLTPAARGVSWPAALLLYAAAFAALGFCRAHWHFVLVVGLAAGVAASIVFVVPVATIGQYYRRRRAAATGLAIVGPAASAASSFRCCLRASASGSASRGRRASLLPDLRVLLRVPVLLMTAGVFFIEWGFFIGLEYVASCALAHGAGRKLSNLMIVFLNAGSFFGRWLPGIMADRFGRLNTMILTNLLCITAMFAIWLPARVSVATIVLFSVVFGFASGSNVSLVPVGVGEYCTTDNYGTTVYTVVSFGALTGVPIAGQILQSSGGSYTGLVIFVGAAYVAGMACFSATWMINRVRYQGGKA